MKFTLERQKSNVVKLCSKHGELTQDEISRKRICKHCAREYAKKAYNDPIQKERRAIRQKAYRRTEKGKALQRKVMKRVVNNLTNGYVRHILIDAGFNKSIITPEMISIKRTQIQMKRAIRQKKEDSGWVEFPTTSKDREYLRDIESYLTKLKERNNGK